MSWSVHTKVAREEADGAIEGLAPSFDMAPEVQDQVEVAKQAAHELLAVVAQEEHPGVAISLSGHANVGDGGSRYQAVTVSVSELATDPREDA